MAKAYTVYDTASERILYSIISAAPPTLNPGEAVLDETFVDTPGFCIERGAVAPQHMATGFAVAANGMQLDFTGLPVPCRVLIEGEKGSALFQVTTATWSHTVAEAGEYAVHITPDDAHLLPIEDHVTV